MHLKRYTASGLTGIGSLPQKLCFEGLLQKFCCRCQALSLAPCSIVYKVCFLKCFDWVVCSALVLHIEIARLQAPMLLLQLSSRNLPYLKPTSYVLL
eukprot:535265-Pelagomonas_calceolata.AAC.2